MNPSSAPTQSPPTLQFRTGDKYFTSPNSPSPPPEFQPPPALTLPLSASELRQRRWSLDQYPYIAFIPSWPFVGRFKSWFSTPVDKLELVQDKNGWHLPIKVGKEWKKFEQTSRAVAHCLHKHLIKSSPHFQGLWTVPQKPGQYGYFVAHRSKVVAQQAIEQSIDGFVVFMGYMAFLVCLLRVNLSSPGTMKPLEDVIRAAFRGTEVERQIHPTWIQTCLGPFLDLQIRRHGCIVDVDSCSWISLVPYMIEAKVPVWLYWGSPPFTHRSLAALPWIKGMIPQQRANTTTSRPSSLPDSTRTSNPLARTSNLPSSSNSAVNATSSSRLPSSNLPSSSDSAANATSSPQLPFPEVKKGSGQRPGETMRAYFQRHKKEHAHKRAQETATKRRRRLDQIKAQARKPTPGKGGPTVFTWEKVDDSGCRIRRPMTRGEVQDDFGRIPFDQKFYDSFEEQYDCCSEWSFDPEEDEDVIMNKQADSWDSDDDPICPIPPPASVSKPSMATVPVHSKVVSAQVDPSTFPLTTALTDKAMDAEVPTRTLPSALAPIRPLSPLTKLPADDPMDTETPSASASGTLLAPLTGPLADDAMDTGVHGSTSLSTPAPLSSSEPTLASAAVSVVNLPSNSPDLDTEPGNSSIPVPSLDSGLPSVLQSTELAEDPGLDVLHGDSLEETDFDLSSASKDNVLAMVPLASTSQSLPDEDVFDDFLYYKFGYTLDEAPYRGLPSAFLGTNNAFAQNWSTVMHSVGGDQLPGAGKVQPAVADFLHALISSKRPFHEVPGKYWDLSPANSQALKKRQVKNFSIELRNVGTEVQCLLHPKERAAGSWAVAVSPMMGLECIRRDLGPSEMDLVDHLIENAIPFRTLAPLLSLPPFYRPSPRNSAPLLGVRPKDYRFDLADYAVYEALRDSVMISRPEARRALCYGGIINRLAKEVLPNTVVYAGPSDSAYNGNQSVFRDNIGVLVDDELTEELLDLICGTYYVLTDKGEQVTMKSWYPRPNIWESSGLNVGYWSKEAELWFVDRRNAILAGKEQPLAAHEWRRKLRLSRKSTKVLFAMNAAALSYVESSQGDRLRW